MILARFGGTLRAMSDAQPREDAPKGSNLALVMTGGGACAAYQVGFLRVVARHRPELQVPFLTGVSAGAINAAFLASDTGTFAERVEHLGRVWSELEAKDVFRVGPLGLFHQIIHAGLALVSGGMLAPRRGGMVDTQPLRELLARELGAADGALIGIDFNLRRGGLRAVAMTTSSYTTGQSITWVQGHGIEEWERAHRRSRQSELGVEHVMASSALPLLFPAVQIGAAWYGDGGMRLTAPLAPGIHLGADRILAISTRHLKSHEEADEPAVTGYPRPPRWRAPS